MCGEGLADQADQLNGAEPEQHQGSEWGLKAFTSCKRGRVLEGPELGTAGTTLLVYAPKDVS